MPTRARIYIGLVGFLGIPLYLYCLFRALSEPDLSWLYFALFTILGSFFPITIPSLKEKTQSLSLTVSDIFVFASLLLFGPQVAVAITVTDGIVSNFRGRIRQGYKHFFNIGVLSIVSFLAGNFFYWVVDTPAPLHPSFVQGSIFHFLMAMAATGSVFFTLNSAAVGLAIALTLGLRFSSVWKENFLWASLPTIAGASAGSLIFLLSATISSLTAIFLAIPIILVVYYAFELNLRRVNEAHNHANKIGELYHSTIASLAMAIDAKDQCTHGHVHRVQALALTLANYAGYAKTDEIEGLKAAALLHDIGKLAIPEYILNKPGTLSEWEIQKMRVHPTVGADILDSVPFPYPVVPFVRHHHERWDGKGYPDGLKGEEIPLGARILAIADCYDALRSDRPYRKSLSPESALEYIRTQAGTAYDPTLVKILVERVSEIERQVSDAERLVPESVIQRDQPDRVDQVSDRRNIAHTVFHEIASAQREIQAVYEISQTVGKSLNVSETLTILAEKIRNIIPYDGCAIFLLDSQTDSVLPYHTAGQYAEVLEQLRIRVGDGVTGWVAANNQVLLNVSPAPDFERNPVLGTTFLSCLSVPLAIDRRILGVVSLYRVDQDGFSNDHLRLMETISRQAATAINNAIVYEETQEDAYTDPLTGLPNLRYFKVFGEQELRRANRVNYPVSFVMMDLEHFKTINDQHGHKAGDRALIEIAHILRNQMRKSDTCIRYGGDEFVGILPGVSKHLVNSTMDRIREAIESHKIVFTEDSAISIGISLGSSTFPDDAKELEVLLTLADRSMYRDKVLRIRQARPSAVLQFEKRKVRKKKTH